jgi:NAD(P)H-dependent FMN reductase
MSAPQAGGRKALLLGGSPKPEKSSSESLLAYLGEQLEKQGVDTESVRLIKTVRSKEATAELVAAVAAADLVVLSFPLYWDALPGHVVRVFERVAAARAATTPATRPAFVAVAQGGFPEAEQNQVALQICRNFAAAAGLDWAGGLAMGAGGTLEGLPMSKAGNRVPGVVKALDLTAAALAAGEPVSEEAVRLMAKPAFPPVVLRFMGSWGLRSRYKKEGDGRGLKAKPFG